MCRNFCFCVSASKLSRDAKCSSSLRRIAIIIFRCMSFAPRSDTNKIWPGRTLTIRLDGSCFAPPCHLSLRLATVVRVQAVTSVVETVSARRHAFLPRKYRCRCHLSRGVFASVEPGWNLHLTSLRKSLGLRPSGRFLVRFLDRSPAESNIRHYTGANALP